MKNSHRSQFLALIAAVSCLALPGCGGVNSLSDFYEKVIVGTGKQVVKALDNALELNIDSGTFDKFVTLLFASLLDIPLATLMLIGGVDFRIQEDVDPLKAILFELLYDPSKIPVGFTENDLKLYLMRDGEAVLVDGATFNFEENLVKAEITEEGQYFVAVETPDGETP